MAPNDAELLAARLTRIKYLIDALEVESSNTSKNQQTFAKLKNELDAARTHVKSLDRL